MDTSKKITSYEDACKVLNIQPINEEVFNAFPKEDQRSMLAYHKLTVITRAHLITVGSRIGTTKTNGSITRYSVM